MKRFRLLLTILILSLLGFSTASGQDGCTGAENQLTFSGNQMEGILSASGSLFGNGQEVGYGIKTSLEEKIATIYAHGLWVAGKDLGGNLKGAMSINGLAEGRTDYYPGPLHNGDPDYAPWGPFGDPERGTINSEDCNNWDKIWTVSRTEIEAFREDFNDNGILDDIHLAVFSWPGIGSPIFQDYNGFDLPAWEYHGLAPFLDVDEDGAYNPMQGDYPYVPQSAMLPDLITWHVYNDAGNDHSESLSAQKIQLEIQQTTWAYACSDTDWLDHSVFASYKLVNHAIERIDSTKLGLWTDFDLGCPTDDYIGSAPDLNTFYAYNADNEDGLESGGCPTAESYFGVAPPVQAITFLNHPMASFVYYEGESTNPPVGLQTPQTLQEYYRLLNGKLSNGSLMVAEGNGYDPESNLPTTSFAFSGQPDQPTEWSLFQNPALADRYGIGNVDLGNILPDDIITIDVVYSLHQSADNDHLQNVNLMLATIPEIQEIYDSGFTTLCGVTAVEERDNFTSLAIFPNPASDQITFLLPLETLSDVIVYTATGQAVLRSTNRQTGQAQLDISNLRPGIYFVQTMVGDKMAVGKFVKQ